MSWSERIILFRGLDAIGDSRIACKDGFRGHSEHDQGILRSKVLNLMVLQLP